MKPENEDDPDSKWLKFNTEYFGVWRNITRMRESPEDHEEFVQITNKFAEFLSLNPGKATRNLASDIVLSLTSRRGTSRLLRMAHLTPGPLLCSSCVDTVRSHSPMRRVIDGLASGD
ncbi:MAG: DUF3470 domain-containing protein [Rhodothermaceae bacterium]|nr:DUF3470 domain-containing protein [Rhodothermaceae bacterium]MYG70469.1 DUF3470 domain-containing protein [Rhodothermaceae bacterium]MYJ45176.1 DUF3470 domain-containing protein [Rhodothermaceae bacterium]